MHHTIDPNFTGIETGRLLRKYGVVLTVNCLFYEGKLLDCKHNVAAYEKINKAVTTSYRYYTNKVKTADFLPLSPLKCFLLIFILHSSAYCLEHHY